MIDQDHLGAGNAYFLLCLDLWICTAPTTGDHLDLSDSSDLLAMHTEKSHSFPRDTI